MDLKNLLHSVLPGKVLEAGDKSYDEANNSYSATFNNSIKPSFIVQPTTTQEVSDLLSALHPKLIQNAVHIAIRGTAHTPFAGAANVEDGITIDLRGLKGITLEEGLDHVSIGVGETWGAMYEELGKRGVDVVGGRIGRVGVGGLVLGGGLSLYSTRHGFACDSITSFTVVLASGATVTASPHSHAGLFLSLKSGLNNFGIVTSFTMKTIASGSVWGGVSFHAPESFDQLIQSTLDFLHEDADPDTHIMASKGYAFGKEVVSVCMYQTAGAENAPSLRRFTSLPGKIEGYGTMRTASHIEFCDELSQHSKDGVRSCYASCTIRPDATLISSMHKAWLDVLGRLKDAEGFIFSLGFFPLTKSLLLNSCAAGGNAFGLDPADGPLLIVFINPTWDAGADDGRINSGVEDLLMEFKRLANEREALHQYVFPNYAWDKEELFKDYGEETFKRMREVSGKYDPDGANAVPGGLKIPRNA